MFSPSYACEYRPAFHWDKMGTCQDPEFIAEISGHRVGAIFLLLVGKEPGSAQPQCYEGSSGGNSENYRLSPGQRQVSLNNYPYFCSQKEKQIQKGKKNPTSLLG